MKRALAALVVAVAPGFALAQPPAEGTTHTFIDPVYTGTVFCDTLDQVRAIAEADKPDEVYRRYLYSINERNEPVCLAIVPTAVVSEVTHLGFMHRDGMYFKAWAVETDMNGITAYGLYLEHVEMTLV